MVTGQRPFYALGRTAKPLIPDHSLIKEIATGSYGSVWLARNTAGTFRAIKIIERSRFSEERPFQREYEGLRLFEPISREHEGLMDILHLGRNDEEGYFYYVMEAADDVAHGQQIDPETYEPRTLEHELRLRGRLPVLECVEIAMALLNALSFLHRSKLVHRDLKPSNIIFVNGKVKIADIGLVAEAGAARTMIGSAGFIPPEGPGTPQGDIFSFGRVLYEISMGKDREQFPSPPTQIAELPERAELLEVNAIISKACEPDVKRRYRDAQEMLSDVMLLRRGGRPRQRQRRKEFRSLVGKVCAIAAVLISLLFAGRYLGRQTEREVRWEFSVVTNFTAPGVRDWRYAKLGYFDNNDEPDVLVTASNRFIVKSITGADIGAWDVADVSAEDLHVNVAREIFGPGQEGLFLSWRSNDTNLYVARFDKVSGTTLATSQFQRQGDLGPDGTNGNSAFYDVRILDLQQDGQTELIALLSSSYGPKPRARGICCFNFQTGTRLWEFLTAGYVMSPQLVHLGSTIGPLDIVFGTAAPGNGNVLGDGTDDSHSYLYAISSSGKKLWKHEMGGEFTVCEPLIHRSGRDRQLSILATVRASHVMTNGVGGVLPEGGLLRLYDWQGKRLANDYDLKAMLMSWLSADINDDGEPEILATDRLGRLHILDSKLKPISVTEIVPRAFPGESDWVELMLHTYEDLNGDGKKELLFTSFQVQFISGGDPRGGDVTKTAESQLLALDSQLRLVARHSSKHMQDRFGGAPVVTELTKGGRKVILIFGREITVLELTRSEL